MTNISAETLQQGVAEVIQNYVDSYKGNDAYKSWYAGITNDPDRRKSEHEREKEITCEHFKFWGPLCHTYASAIEKLLEKKGFSIHKEDLKIIASEDPKKEQKYVYVYKAVKKKY